MNYILADHYERESLLPFTFTRPVSHIRVGILTLTEKWEIMLSAKVSFKTQPYLQEKFRLTIGEDNILINGSLFPDQEIVESIMSLQPGQVLLFGGRFMAARINRDGVNEFFSNQNLIPVSYSYQLETPQFLTNLWEIFSRNEEAIRKDFKMLTSGRKSSPIYAPNQLTNMEDIFIEDGARVSASILNASTGPIYISKNAEVMDGCMIRGPFALCEGATLKMGTKIYGATTIGPYCKVGGEITNSVFLGYSNKAHDGFIGNSVIGEWCNLGADTNNSNLKNNYSTVKIWSYAEKMMIETGLQFCGLFMGDHTKCSINTMFNTGTVTGVSANIFGSDFPPKYIPSFGWGGARGFEKFQLNKAVELAERVFDRRNLPFDEIEKSIFSHIYKTTD